MKTPTVEIATVFGPDILVAADGYWNRVGGGPGAVSPSGKAQVLADYRIGALLQRLAIPLISEIDGEQNPFDARWVDYALRAGSRHRNDEPTQKVCSDGAALLLRSDAEWRARRW